MCELRAAVYARISSDQQPIGHQLAELRGRVAADEVRVPAEWELVDDGYSGETLVRPGLDRLRELVAEGGIERLYVQSPDRLARKYAYQALLLDEFQAAGIEVVFVDRLHATPGDDAGSWLRS
jgi:site-specific DNA recombinase